MGFGSNRSAEAVLKALDCSLAVIEFDPNGTILTANQNFCAALGYSLSEIKGRHHSLFVEPAYAQSPEYRAFWAKLGRGEFDAQEYQRVGKGGKDVWIQASYNPIKNASGRVVKVVKVATDVTAEKLRIAEFSSKLNAISRAQAIIEFTPEGEIITANENFLKTLGYGLGEIQGKHHRMFVEPAYAQSNEYQAFWRTLKSGEFIADEFKRIGKGGKAVWIQATYNPIFDLNNRVDKIVKFATDITGRVEAVNEIGQGLGELADNNLAHRLKSPFIAAFEPLRGDFNRSLERLQTAMQQVAESAESVQVGTRQISESSDDLSRRTEQQAASLEETAAAMEEITITVQRSADGARQASNAASGAATDTEKSRKVMSEAVAAMSEIEQSSSQITQIIGVIDEIAFQTNLLALNAGVEAARAGDAGRGFAVVAQEVRGLAQRSADAAKEIKTLIASSSNQVARGVKLVGEAGHALQGIAGKVTEIDALIAEIAKSAQEQTVGLTQINVAVSQMDQMTQQNAAMVEESSAAALGLKTEAVEMAGLISQFKIGRSGASAKSSPARPRLAQPGRDTPAPSPAARSQAKLIVAMKAGGAQLSEHDWEEF